MGLFDFLHQQAAKGNKGEESKDANQAEISGAIENEQPKEIVTELTQVDAVEDKVNTQEEENFKNAKNDDNKWQSDYTGSLALQRNLMFFLVVVFAVTIAGSAFTINYLQSTRSVEPFIIEIEPKTGVTTVIKRHKEEIFTEDEAVKKYFVMKYIRAREGYTSHTFRNNFNEVVRVLSDDDVYYRDYRPKFQTNNPNSPINILGTNSTRRVLLKSIIFPTKNSVQVRVQLKSEGVYNAVENKIIYMEFSFDNIKMDEEERLVNPLGFKVTLYRMDDELIQ